MHARRSVAAFSAIVKHAHSSNLTEQVVLSSTFPPFLPPSLPLLDAQIFSELASVCWLFPRLVNKEGYFQCYLSVSSSTSCMNASICVSDAVGCVRYAADVKGTLWFPLYLQRFRNG
jgi:hypothetical protein